jgi:hypothetical protein
VFDEVGAFDISFRAAADEDFFLRALRSGFCAKQVRCYFSAFTLAENNLGGRALADREHWEMKARASAWVRVFRPVVNLARRTEKFLSGAYGQKFPLEYAIYADDLNARARFYAANGSWKWPASKCSDRG